MRFAISTCLILASVGLLTAGCAKPKYLLDGLQLPPSAVEVEFQEYKHEGFNVISSTFNCDGGWDSVVAHFDLILKRAGYTESVPGGSMLDDATDEEALHSKDAMRYYTKPGSDYSVQITNHTVMIEESSLDLTAADVEEQGEFGLVVMKFELSK